MPKAFHKRLFKYCLERKWITKEATVWAALGACILLLIVIIGWNSLLRACFYFKQGQSVGYSIIKCF